MPRNIKPFKKGNRWHVVYTVKDDDGAWNKVGKSFVNEYDALAYANEINRKRAAGIKMTMPTEEEKMQAKLTVSDFLLNYIQVSAERWKPSTMENNSRLFSNYIKPYFNNIRLSDLTPKIMEAFFESKISMVTSDGKIRVATKSVREKIYVFMKGAMTYALKKGFVSNDMMTGVSAEHYGVHEIQSYSKDKLEKMIFECSDVLLQKFMYLMYYCTMRVGEACALRKSDFTLSENGDYYIININKEVGRYGIEYLNRVKACQDPEAEKVIEIFDSCNSNNTTRVAVLSPKTKGSVRRGFLSKELVESLFNLENGGEDFYLFSADGKTPYTPEFFNKRLKKYCMRNGLPVITISSIRHTSCNAAMDGPGGLRTAMANGGWTDFCTPQRIYNNSHTEERLELMHVLNSRFFCYEDAAKNF